MKRAGDLRAIPTNGKEVTPALFDSNLDLIVRQFEDQRREYRDLRNGVRGDGLIGSFNYADLRTIVADEGDVANVYGRATSSDGCEGQFVFHHGVAVDNDATIIVVPGVGWWERIAPGAASVNVANFGGNSNALYYNPADGRWYTTAAYTTEADDDAVKFQRASDYLAALGGGKIFVPAGNWYFRTKHGSAGEFVVPASNITFEGCGAASKIRIRGGMNTPANGGYSCAIGRFCFDTTSAAIDNLVVRNIAFDHNSAHNQWTLPNYGGVSYPQNAAVSLPRGENNIAEDLYISNHNGVFAIVMGIYGDTSLSRNARVSNCKMFHMLDDPLQGDASLIAFTSTGGVVDNNTIDWGGSANVAWPNGAPSTAYEIHGSQTLVTGNRAYGFDCGFNVAADSDNSEQVTISNNIVKQCTTGCRWFSIYGKAFRKLTVDGNQFFIRATGNPAGPEVGIGSAVPTALGQANGLGYYDCRITNNTIVGPPTPTVNSSAINISGNFGGDELSVPVWAPLTAYSQYYQWPHVRRPTMGNGYYYTCIIGGTSGAVEPTWPTAINADVVDGTVTWRCTGLLDTASSIYTGGGIDIINNKIRSWDNGILLGPPSVLGTGQNIRDIRIIDNSLWNAGYYGILIGGSASDTSPDISHCEIRDNTIADDRGSPRLQWGIYMAGWTDTSCIVRDNTVRGRAQGDILINTATFPTATMCAIQGKSVEAYIFGINASAADNSRSLQAAIDFASANAVGIVDIPAGTYLFTNDVNIKSNVVIRGLGRAATTLSFSGLAALRSISTTKTGLENLRVIGSSANGALTLSCFANTTLQHFYAIECTFQTTSATGCAVLSKGNTGAGGNGYVYWPTFTNCEFLGVPGAAGCTGFKGDSFPGGNGTLFARFIGGRFNGFGKHIDLSYCGGARGIGIEFDDCSVGGTGRFIYFGTGAGENAFYGTHFEASGIDKAIEFTAGSSQNHVEDDTRLDFSYVVGLTAGTQNSTSGFQQVSATDSNLGKGPQTFLLLQDSISEKTAGNGVDVDGLKCKDGAIWGEVWTAAGIPAFVPGASLHGLRRPDDASNQLAFGNGYAYFYGSNQFYDPSANGHGLDINVDIPVTTTNGTPTDIRAEAIAASTSCSIRFLLVCRRTGGSRGTGAVGDTAKFERRVTVRNVAGTVTIVGTETVGTDTADADLVAAAVTVSPVVSGTNVKIQGTGAANLTLKWQALAYVESFVS